MRSEALLAGVAALHFAAVPAARGAEAPVMVHVCGSDAAIPLNLPPRERRDGQTPCHGSMAPAADKKKARGGAGG